MSEPEKEFLRWRDVCDWLKELGISYRQIKKFKSEGKIKACVFKGRVRAHYLKSQIKKDVLNDSGNDRQSNP